MLLPCIRVEPIRMFALCPGLLQFRGHVLENPRETILLYDGFMCVSRQKSLVVDNSAGMLHDCTLHVRDLVPVQPAVYQPVSERCIYTAAPDVELVRNAEAV